METKGITIAIDFDGTCVTHEFPNIGKEIGAVSVLKKLIQAKHQLILFTMRSNHGNLPLFTPTGIESTSGDFLDDAVNWFKNNNIPLYGINENPTQKSWTKSPKAYAELYLDDAALGIPLKYDVILSTRPFVDWDSVEELLIKRGILN